jgi:aryl-alcohol dehydrogenase-like predicted oxidoreductase
MQMRRLGRSDLLVSPLCLGGNVFGWSADRKTSFAVLDAYVAHGFNFIDTADVYSRWVEGNKGGESEEIIGAWMRERGNRSRVIVTTKVGSEMGEGKKGLSRAYIREALEASLRRLATDHIDLYLSHWEDMDTSLEETLGVYAELVQEGKVRVIGNSNHSAGTMREALAISARNGWPRFENLQTHYNLYDRAGYENELEPFCVENGLGVTSYFSLAKGFLSGKYRSAADAGKSSARGGGMASYLDARGKRILAALDRVSADLAATPAQIALAWLMARPSLTSAIASATSVAQLDELAGAVKLKLDAGSIAALDEASS